MSSTAPETSPRRVRHLARDGIALMLFSLGTSGLLALSIQLLAGLGR